MNELEIQQILGQVPPINGQEALRNLLLALALGLCVAVLHRATNFRSKPSPALLSALALLPPIGSMVMMVIGNSLARAFSLVGALAIIRFRTRLRSPWDISFVFLSLTLGVACGVGAHEVALIGMAVVGLGILVIGALPGTRPQPEAYVLRCEVAAHQVGERELAPLMTPHLEESQLNEAHTRRFGEALSLTWRVVLKPDATLEALIRELAAVEGVERVTVVSNFDAVTEPE